MSRAAAAVLIDLLRQVRTRLSDTPVESLELAHGWASGQAAGSVYAANLEPMQGICMALQCEIARRAHNSQAAPEAAIDPDAQCPEHGCSRWRCDESH